MRGPTIPLSDGGIRGEVERRVAALAMDRAAHFGQGEIAVGARPLPMYSSVPPFRTRLSAALDDFPIVLFVPPFVRTHEH